MNLFVLSLHTVAFLGKYDLTRKREISGNDEFPSILESSNICLSSNGEQLGRLLWRLPWNTVSVEEGDIPDERKVPQPTPEYTRKALSFVNEWTRHSDAKVGVMLACAGVLETMTFYLHRHPAFSHRTVINQNFGCKTMGGSNIVL